MKKGTKDIAFHDVILIVFDAIKIPRYQSSKNTWCRVLFHAWYFTHD